MDSLVIDAILIVFSTASFAASAVACYRMTEIKVRLDNLERAGIIIAADNPLTPDPPVMRKSRRQRVREAEMAEALGKAS